MANTSSIHGLTIDTRNFAAALKEYSQVSRRDNSYIINKVAGDVAFLTAEEMPIATRESIDSLEQRPWWVKYISKLLSTKGFSQTKTTNSKKKGKVTKTFRVRAGKFSRKQARAVSKRIIKGRKQGVGLLKYAWITSALLIKRGSDMAGGLLTGSRKLRNSQGRAFRATPYNLEAIIEAIYDFKDEKHKVTAEAIVKPHLQSAMDAKARDMREYIERKQAELAAKYNGVGK
jgi:hypothetical protein